MIQLGHPPGYACPTARDADKGFVLIDLTGIHILKVRFCECDGRIEHRQQLMRVRWWPATVKDPKTCATFAVIRLFQILNCQGKVSAHDFVHSLELLTNNDGLDPPPVRAMDRDGFYADIEFRSPEGGLFDTLCASIAPPS